MQPPTPMVPTLYQPAPTVKIRQAGENARFPEKLEFLFYPHRYKIAYGGRGGAKSWNFARALLLLAMNRVLHILCARETQKSIKDSVHKLLADQIHALNIGHFFEIQQHAIIGRNGSDFFFAGLKHNINNIKSIEACDIVWVEEGQSVSDDSWQTLIPTIRKDGSEIWVCFNPKFEDDAAYKRFVLSAPRSARVVEINWRDNPWFPETLAKEREDLLLTDPEEEEHVYGGKCVTSVKGAIYGRELKALKAAGQICAVPYDRSKPVHTCWDLGHGDDTAIWFVQAYGGWYNLIDFHEDHGRSIEHYLIELQAKKYVYGTDFLPHDGIDAIIHQKLAGDRTKSIEMIMRAAGRTVRIVPKMYVSDGLNAVRTLLPQCRFDERKCDEGLRHLRLYQWGPKTDLGVSRREPLHDGNSHAADALRVLALGVKQPEREPDEESQRPAAQAPPGYAPFG